MGRQLPGLISAEAEEMILSPAFRPTERAAYIGRIRQISRAVAQSYYDSRERLGFPMCQKKE